MLKALFVLGLAVAPTVAEPFTVRVSVYVSGDPSWQSQLESCLARELRSLPGVVVTAQNPLVRVDVAALKMKGDPGFALSVMIVSSGVPEHGVDTGPQLDGVCKMVAAYVDRRAVEPAREAWQARQDLTPDESMATHHE